MKKEYYNLVEDHINKTENYSYGENETPLEDTTIKNLKDLYHYGLKEFGKCISKAYIDKKDGASQHIGYVFQKKRQYEDTKEFYLAESWLSIEHYIETIEREYLPIK